MSTGRGINIGIVGCGHWGPNYVRALSGLPRCHVTHACDTDETQLARLLAQHPGLTVTARFDDILEDPIVDGVVVATPASSHFRIASRAIEAGKHVLVEKPMTTSDRDALDLTEMAREYGRILMVGHIFLYNPGVTRFREYIQTGRLGQVYYLNARRTHLGLVRDDVNVLWDLAPHDIAIFSFLLGRAPMTASAVGTCHLRDNKEDVVFATLQYPDSVIGHIHVSWLDSKKERRIHVAGSMAHGVFDDIDLIERLKIYEKGIASNVSTGDGFEFPYLLRDGDIHSPRIEIKEPLKEMCSHFVDCIDEGKPPFTSGSDGLEVVRVLCAMQRSLSAGGAPVSIVR